MDTGASVFRVSALQRGGGGGGFNESQRESSPESRSNQKEQAASLWRAGAMSQSPTGQHYQQSKRRHSKGGLPIVKRMANRAAYHIRGAT